MMKLDSRKIIACIGLVVMLSGCNTATLKYQLDPEINHLGKLAGNTKIVAVSVTDARKVIASPNSNQALVSGPDNEAKVLKDKLTSILKQNGYKIINKPLLADVAFSIEILTLELTIESATFKSTIRGKSELKLTVNKHSQHWSKIYKASREQEVANPANNLDATGVMNQMLTKQLSTAFSDPSLRDFILKP